MAVQLHHHEQLNGQLQPRHQSPAPSLQGYIVPEKREVDEIHAPSAGGVNPYFQPAEPSVVNGAPPAKKRAIGPSVRTGQACDRCKVRLVLSGVEDTSNTILTRRTVKYDVIPTQMAARHADRIIPNARRPIESPAGHLFEGMLRTWKETMS